MRKGVKHLSIDEKAEIRCWKRLGKSDLFIAHKLGRADTTIARYMASKDKPLRQMRKIKRVSERRKLIYKYAEMMTWEERKWKVWEGTKREQVRTRMYVRPTYPNSASIRLVLFEKHGIRASNWAVWHDLQMGGFIWRRRTKVVTMDPQHFKNRLSFAKEIKPKIPGLFLGFADECSISIAVDSTLIFHYRRKDQPALPRLAARASGKDEKVHVWACIAEGYRKIIVFDSSVTQEVYTTQCLSAIWKDMKRMGMTLVQDNAGAHGSDSKDFLYERGCFFLEIPTYSPDINVIERLWIHLKRRVSARYPTRKDDLKKIVLEEFAAIPQSTIDGICGGFENAIDRVIEQKGQHFKSRK